MDWDEPNPKNGMPRLWDISSNVSGNSDIISTIADLVDTEVSNAFKFYSEEKSDTVLWPGYLIQPYMPEAGEHDIYVVVYFSDVEEFYPIAPKPLEELIRESMSELDSWEEIRAWKRIRDLVNADLKKAHERTVERVKLRKAILEKSGVDKADWDDDLDDFEEL